jgi:hypothetical protein
MTNIPFGVVVHPRAFHGIRMYDPNRAQTGRYGPGHRTLSRWAEVHQAPSHASQPVPGALFTAAISIFISAAKRRQFPCTNSSDALVSAPEVLSPRDLNRNVKNVVFETQLI